MERPYEDAHPEPLALVREGHGLPWSAGALEKRFPITMVAALAQKEKQIQQNYRPVIGVHKWFARRPGALFRALLLSEFAAAGETKDHYFRPHALHPYTILDPFMGGGTPLFEANRLGMNVIGCDVNPMAYWIVHQELAPLDRGAFHSIAGKVLEDVESTIGALYRTTCIFCGERDATVKYFLWVKQQRCASCSTYFDLSPGALVAENARHPNFVLYCQHCHKLTEKTTLPEGDVRCHHCRRQILLHGTARKNRYTCPHCSHQGRYPHELAELGPPQHRLFAMEYWCEGCKPHHAGRFFKTPDPADLARVTRANKSLRAIHPKIPPDPVPDGAETKRLHRWGYRYFRDLFNERQLLGLGLLAERIGKIDDQSVRHALATVFSDILRYQNMLCRYDTMALKCQDIFSVHGFPVGLIQCENNLLGIPGVGTGGFRHFVEKYDRAKAYCEQPFETAFDRAGHKQRVVVRGERIHATFVDHAPSSTEFRAAWIAPASVEDLPLLANSIDGVFTDPPYYDNVQYAELMDFCYAWLRQILGDEVRAFQAATTRTTRELTGNETLGRGLEFFTTGLSKVFAASAAALKPGAPFVFTYHHNDIEAYAPVCVALLDSRLLCTAVLPAPAEMEASLHINGTGSSTVDSVIVARRDPLTTPDALTAPDALEKALLKDSTELAAASLRVTRGDLTCLALGLIMASANRQLLPCWDECATPAEKLARVRALLLSIAEAIDLQKIIDRVHKATPRLKDLGLQLPLL